MSDEVREPDYSGDPPQEYFDQFEKDEEAAGRRGKCKDCGHRFSKFTSVDFNGKLCNKCFSKEKEVDGRMRDRWRSHFTRQEEEGI